MSVVSTAVHDEWIVLFFFSIQQNNLEIALYMYLSPCELHDNVAVMIVPSFVQLRTLRADSE